MGRLWAACWACLLLSVLLLCCEPALGKGGRGGSRGSSRGTSSRSTNAGKYNGGGARSRFRSAGRSSPVRVAAAAAAGAAVALTADGWYASAYRRTKPDGSEEERDYDGNGTEYLDAAPTSRSPQHASPLTRVVSVLLATLCPAYGAMLDGMLY
ncbi:unnamed protein product [Merluccius merluccius]